MIKYIQTAIFVIIGSLSVLYLISRYHPVENRATGILVHILSPTKNIEDIMK